MLGFRAFLFVLFAIVSMVMDHRSSEFHRFRARLSVVILPVQVLVNTPIKWAHWLGTSVTAQQRLLEENARLRAHELLLESKLQKLLVLEHENAHLKELLKSTVRIAGRVKVAQLLAVDLDPTVQQIVLDKGSHDHVYLGQPVLDAYGVMGQVVDIGPMTSRILLITDPRSAIPVKDYRNGLRAIAVGLGASQGLALIHVTDVVNIKVGDLFVTSGLGLRFPVGYPVGVVSNIQKVSGRRFVTVTLIPSARLNQTQQVILAWPNQQALTKAVRTQLYDSGKTSIVNST